MDAAAHALAKSDYDRCGLPEDPSFAVCLWAALFAGGSNNFRLSLRRKVRAGHVYQEHGSVSRKRIRNVDSIVPRDTSTDSYGLPSFAGGWDLDDELEDA
jgi:hypothetical protein